MVLEPAVSEVLNVIHSQTRPFMTFKPSLAVATLAAAVLVSCGGSSSPPAAAGGSGKIGNEEFGLSLEALTTRVETTEKAIGECMKAAGFEYTPADFASIKQAMDSDKTAPGLSDEAYVAEFGFGITTQFDKPIVSFGAGPKNMSVLNALAESDQDAYRRELWGEALEWTHVRALEEEDFSETEGCTKAAVDKAYSPDELGGSYVNPGDKLVEQDPRMVKALTAWSECVKEGGYTYDHPDQIIDDLTTRLEAITQGEDPQTITSPALTELQGLEKAIAVVASECEAEHIEDVQVQVEAEVYGAAPT
jgi:hypothetical protein